VLAWTHSTHMNQQILIDAIVRQTMVLIARLSTVDGVRSPLSHIADEVFVGLVDELESQRVGKKVIADMFGLALCSYRQKVQRLRESATSRGVTLWAALHSFLASTETATRAEVLQHFASDDERTVRGILNDLVETGLVMRSGKGEVTRYRVATESELFELGTSASAQPEESAAALVWLHVYRDGPLKREQLTQRLNFAATSLDAALESLIKHGQIRVATTTEGTHYSTEHCFIPFGQAGWEAAVIDHYGTVLNALAAKVTKGEHTSAARDEVGGSTFTFDIWPGHPKEQEVRRLLATTREHIVSLWEDVTEHNKVQATSNGYQVSYYCGQYVVKESEQL